MRRSFVGNGKCARAHPPAKPGRSHTNLYTSITMYEMADFPIGHPDKLPVDLAPYDGVRTKFSEY